MVLDAERWLELRRFRALRDAGLSISEIARETGLHRRTVRKYLNAELGQAPQRLRVRGGLWRWTRSRTLSTRGCGRSCCSKAP